MSFTLDQLALNRGWRFKITDGDRLRGLDTPFTLDPDEKETIQQLDVDDEDVFAGWLMGAFATSTSEDLAVQAITEPAGAEGQRRSGVISAGELLQTGANEPKTSSPWAKQTTVGGTDYYSVWFNGFDGFGAPTRFPEMSRVEVKNTGSSSITVTGFRVSSILIHQPKTFFRQLAAYNAAQGSIPPSRVEKLDEETLSDLINIMEEKPE